MTKPLKARSTRFEKIQTSTSATLGANPASSASRHPIDEPFPPRPAGNPDDPTVTQAGMPQPHPPRVDLPCSNVRGPSVRCRMEQVEEAHQTRSRGQLGWSAPS